MKTMDRVSIPVNTEVNSTVWGEGWFLLAWHTMHKGLRNETTTLWLWRMNDERYCTIDLSYVQLPS